MSTTLGAVTLGVGHLRRQVAFYGSNLGLRVVNKGRVPAEVCRQIWEVDEELDVVTVARQDLPDSLQVRLVRTSDLAARPDFDLSVPGPVGLTYATKDIRRLYYRLSGAGVEFHAGPADESDAEEGDRHDRIFGRAYDGEYIILESSAGTTASGTMSPYFGVTEPLEVVLVVSDMEASALFLVEGLGQDPLDQGRIDDESWRRAMGLPPGASFLWRTFGSARGGARLRLLCFADGQNQEPVKPPARGLSSLRFDTEDFDRALGRLRRAGAGVATPRSSVSHAAVGGGWVASLTSPLGICIELWQPRSA